LSDSPNPSPENPIDPTTAALIRCKSGQVLWQAGLSRSNREDVEQTLTLLLLRRLAQFDAGKGDRTAFVRMVLRQATVNVLRYYRAAKRSGTVVSLDARIRTETDEPLEPAARAEPPARADAPLDVAAALAALPAELRMIAEELRTHSIAEAARNLGISRTTLHARVQEIRTVFEGRALDDYL
jgi:DNA-directed RNA polymerase specialized sigma24 family protein